MLPGAITEHLDVPQLAVAGFFLFFLGLVFYLRREDRREGYPVDDPTEAGRPNRTAPAPKLFTLLEGGQTAAPHHFPPPPMNAIRRFVTAGTRLTPTGDPLLAAVGPSTFVMRSDQPFMGMDRQPELQPLRIAAGWSVLPGDTDPRGMAVADARGRPVGTVTELWVDREVKILRYLEVTLAAVPRIVLLPIYAADIDRRRRVVRVAELLTEQFVNVPALAHPDRISAREEDQVNAYYAGGGFFNRQTGATR